MIEQDEMLYDRMRAGFEPVRMTGELDEVTSRGGVLRRRRRAGASAGAVLAVAVLAVAFNLPASKPLELVAWSVAPEPDGTVSLTIRELADADGLSATLKRVGVPARVDFLPAGSPSCDDDQEGRPELHRVLNPERGRDGEIRYRIRPDAMPAGTSLHLVIVDEGPGSHVLMSLVDGAPDPC
ncbi:hypothetical protein Ait01nite_093550 [Actinoplanes italicus]|uniref:Uncharacterized protein n=1 Tax=Actinoplanes italicus TaxID=113567 RepID=A0A2T0JPE6_9ACTN|nr:hypothetical protein [Actinoplanes italicus]PRX09498.1 hypothetical protein CLV67_13674 [Actinoplanes italicus]GIE36310.1 hypothetical protein Ait01nite_093550 [Actinoplanes italicus]